MAPDSSSGPSNHSRISRIRAKGDCGPACPPAPAATAISPSAPLSMALCAKVLLMMSCSTMPPQECAASFTSTRAPSEVIQIGTLCLHADLQIPVQPRVGAMHDLVDRKGRGGLVRVGLIVAVQFFGDLGQPGVQQRMLALALARIQRRETSRRCRPCIARSPVRAPK